MQLSVSIPTFDPSLAGLLAGVAAPAAAASGEGVPPLTGEGFADLLANVTAPAVSLAPATPAAAMTLTPPVAFTSVAAPTPLPALPVPALPFSEEDAMTPLAPVWPFAANLRLPVTGTPAAANPPEIAAPGSRGPGVAPGVAVTTAMPGTDLESATLGAQPSPPGARGATPREENQKGENKPADETIAMALASITLPLMSAAPETGTPTLVSEPTVVTEEEATEEGSSESETAAVLAHPAGEGAQTPQRPAAGVRFASAFSPASPIRFAPSVRETTPTPVADDRVRSTEPLAVSQDTLLETPVESSELVAGTSARPIAPERNVAARRPLAIPANEEPSVMRPLTSTPIPAFTPRPNTGSASASNVAPDATSAPTAKAAPVPATELVMASLPTPVAAAPIVRAESPLIPPAAQTLSDDAAKIAVERDIAATEPAVREFGPPRNFVTPNGKQVTSRPQGLGTSVAKLTDAMSSAQSTNRSAPADFPPASLVLNRTTETSEVSSTSPALTPEATSTAHRAVEAVLTAAHRFSTGERQAVSLQFSVGDADLRVRVEMRADEVRATFRTDSAELRAALSHEWNSTNANAGERPFRLATPVFASNDASAFSAASGDQASQQQQQQRESAARQANDPFAAITSRSRVGRDSAAAAPVANAAPRAPLSTTRHLHTLA
jgi:hypothetical protein